MKKFLIILIALVLVLGGSFLVYSLIINKSDNITEQNDTDDTDNIDNISTLTPKPTPTKSPTDKLLESMTLEEKIGQMFIVTLGELETGNINGGYPTFISDNQIATLQKYNVGGVIFFADNLTNSKDDLTTYISKLQENSKYKMFISVDEEGGIVSRLGSNGHMDVTKYPNMVEIGNTADPSKAYDVGTTLGSQMKVLGFNVDFAPVSDVNTNLNNPVIGKRAFGNTSDIVAKMVPEEVKGLQENNVSATLKHFPGHGDTSTDSHTGLPKVEKTLDDLRSLELLPFKGGIEAGVDFILTAHIDLPNITGTDLPATMSKTIVTDLLRTELGFKNIIITDALNMGAIANNYTTKETILNCIDAGIDIMLMPVELDTATSTIKDAVDNGTITEERINESVKRIIDIKLKRGVISI